MFGKSNIFFVDVAVNKSLKLKYFFLMNSKIRILQMSPIVLSYVYASLYNVFLFCKNRLYVYIMLNTKRVHCVPFFIFGFVGMAREKRLWEKEYRGTRVLLLV